MPSPPVIYDTTSGTRGVREKIVKEYRDKTRTTWIPYSNGVEIKMEKVADGDGKKGPDHRLKEVRAITGIKTPKTTVQVQYRHGEYERIFGKEGP